MGKQGSVTRLVNQLQAHDKAERDEAADEIWKRYSGQLLALARRKLHQKLRRREDEDDVLQSMFKSFCARQQRGEFNLQNREDLWAILVTITMRKVVNTIKRHTRQGRDFRREQVNDAADASGHERAGLEVDLSSSDLDPAQEAAAWDEIERRFQVLSESQRQIALWKIEGYTNEEIAGPQMLDCAVRTVERKLKVIRQKWEKMD